jgi:hypothetical protein
MSQQAASSLDISVINISIPFFKAGRNQDNIKSPAYILKLYRTVEIFRIYVLLFMKIWYYNTNQAAIMNYKLNIQDLSLGC